MQLTEGSVRVLSHDLCSAAYHQPVYFAMKKSTRISTLISLILLASLLSPTAVLAFGDGKKHFKKGVKYEVAEEWDKAAEEFTLAVADNPKNPEYRLHLQRALFNASQQYIKKGTLAAKEKDYEAGYIAFRKAYAFDPTNELAKSEMERMIRLQKAANPVPADKEKKVVDDGSRFVPTAFGTVKLPAGAQVPQKLEKVRDLVFPNGVDLQFIIKDLARDLDLNVLFDIESFRTAGRKTAIDLKNVTAARALDYIFLQEGLFFQKVGPHTILVAAQAQRTKFQQLVLRTFYLANASPKDVQKVVQTAIPAQPGRSQTIVLTDDATNSVTVRDTAENIRLIGQLIRSLDKDRAEVVMDVGIYEVNKSDLMQFGNQIGTGGDQGSLLNLGGAGFGILRSGDSGLITGGMFPGLNAAGIAFGLPISNFTALQSKSNTKLIASTQIHAFNNEDSSARIGQRVPVQSAQFVTGATNAGTGAGVVSNVINYEQVGLTLKFKPLVFPNQDVQVAMEIESKDVAGARTLTPTFTERTIKGTARVQNNKTLLLASVAQGVESKGRTGLPLLGLIPILGRLFTAPTRDNRQVDIVIAITPRVIRAPAILPEDEAERETGSLAVPTTNNLEAMVLEDAQEDLLAAARRIPTNTQVQLPDQQEQAPEYVKGDTTAAVSQPSNAQSVAAVPTLKPIDASVKTLKLTETADMGATTAAAAARAAVTLGTMPSSMKAGETARIAILADGSAQFGSAVVGLKFDPAKVAVRNVVLGSIFGDKADTPVTPFLNQGGRTYISLISPNGTVSANGVLAFIEVEALADGEPAVSFDRSMLNMLGEDGSPIAVKVIE